MAPAGHPVCSESTVMKQPKATTPTKSKRRIVRRFTGRMRLTAIAVFVVLVVGAVMMLGANQSTEATATPEPLKLVSAAEVEPAPPVQPTRRTASRKPAATASPAKATALPAKSTTSPTAAPAPAVASAPANASSAINGEVVTITGCLEADNR